MKNRTCFILMPFSNVNDLNNQDLNYIYEHMIKKAVESYKVNESVFFTNVLRFENKVGSIINGIVEKLNSADLVIADLTGLNPNVMYELGVRHSLKKGTIIITQDIEKLPSDLRDYLHVEYHYKKSDIIEQARNFEIFLENIHRAIHEVFGSNKYDSPVLNYLETKKRFRDEDEINRLKSNAVIVEVIADKCDYISRLISQFYNGAFKTEPELFFTHLFHLQINTLTTALNELNILHNSTILYENITAARVMLEEVNKLFSFHEYMVSSADFTNNPEVPEGVFGKGITNKHLLEKEILNLFSLLRGKPLSFANSIDIFKENGILSLELLDLLDEYIESNMARLGVEKSELEKVLTS